MGENEYFPPWRPDRVLLFKNQTSEFKSIEIIGTEPLDDFKNNP
jgi:hypothetical protein